MTIPLKNTVSDQLLSVFPAASLSGILINGDNIQDKQTFLTEFAEKLQYSRILWV